MNIDPVVATPPANKRLAEAMENWPTASSIAEPFVVGVLPGEGIGPDVIGASLLVLSAIERATPYRFELRAGGKIGSEAERATGRVLTDEVIAFCESVFDDQGAILCGPGGGRFVYELRLRFDLYCKMVPLKPFASLKNAGVLRPEATEGVDIVVIRENVGGLYFGTFGTDTRDGSHCAHQQFHYHEEQVKRILGVAFRVAKMRRKRLCVVTKPGGAPTISELWKHQAQLLGIFEPVEVRHLEVDTAAYELVANARDFDVVVAPNMFGDVLADGAAVLLGSRGMSVSANLSDQGRAVYQTGHGAAYDLAGANRANPIGQIQSLAMMLSESFGLMKLKAEILGAIDDTLAVGWRTADIMAPGCRLVGTQELTARIADLLGARLMALQAPLAA